METAQLPPAERSTAAADFGDFDSDGDADIYIGNVGGDAGEPSCLYLNKRLRALRGTL